MCDMRKILSLYMLLSLVALQPAWSQEDKMKGDSAYIRGDYAAAIEIYEALLRQGEAAELYYNLGNSYYKQEELGRAILNYERALLLQPGNADVQANLEIARAKTVDKVVPAPEIFFLAWISKIAFCANSTL